MYIGKHALCRNAKCPFFRSEYQKTITCTETDFKLLFANEERKDEYAGKYCIKEFPYECPIYAGLASKYE